MTIRTIDQIMARLPVSFLVFLIPVYCHAQSKPLDYSDATNWAVIPGDTIEVWQSLPINGSLNDVDVFYVYPTLLTDDKDKRWNYPIEDEDHRESVITSTVKYQASAWADAGRVYVPYYRQAHLRSYDKLEKGGEEALLFAYEDVRASFQYYLDYFNDGRPIILAGHSQGSTHLSRIVKEFFDEKPLQDRLVAAYLPGIGIPRDFYSSIKLMTSPDEIGGYVTWNTCKRRYNTERYRKWYKGKAAINPVTWDSTVVVEKSNHRGFLYTNDKLYKNSFDTHLVDGAIWITAPKFPMRVMTIWMKNYHVGDVNLFWEDIRLNAKVRAQVYLMQSK